MKASVHFATRTHLPRRTFLKAAGLSMALPFLDAMVPAFASAGATAPPRRFVSFTLGLGLHEANLVPEQRGRGYTPSLYLRQIPDLLDDLTVFSGVSHPGVKGGHRAEACILTAAPLSRSDANFRNSISLDQYMAKHLGSHTRFRSLVLNTADGDGSPSYTENGAMIPPETSPTRLFRQLFIDDAVSTQSARIARLRHGRSVMDIVAEEARALQRTLGAGDREKLEAYFTSVNELEHHLASSEDWVRRPKPKVAAEPPAEITNRNDILARQRTMFDVIALALQTDSTRFVTLHLGGGGSERVPIEGVEEGYHSLSHHGKDEEKIQQLTLIEQEIVRTWGAFLRKLKETPEQGGSLLDRSMVLLTSNLGNASSHDNRNMPVLLAGGGFRHGQHLAFDRTENYPLPNLFLSALHRLGLESENFSTSTGTMTGLDMA